MISSDDIERNGFTWSYADNIPKLITGSPIIVNTDIEGGQGVHWIVITKLNNRAIHIYDPLGARNQRVASDGSETTSIITKQLTGNIVYYPYASQRATTTRCGWFALYVANMIRKAHYTNAQDINKAIKDKFGTSADKKDEQVLAVAFT